MGKLCIYLPPFAPDYSGVCSALFDLNNLIVIHDASGCTGNYTGFDEPRWYGSKKRIYCSGLRRDNAIMGGESIFAERIKKAISDVGIPPDFIALVGSPVPLVIGTDFTGFAREVAEATGIKCLPFPTTGTKYYHEGVYSATKALLENYGTPRDTVKGTLNILGATPLDISNENLDALQALLAENGYSTGACFSMGLDLNGVAQARAAEANIAISQSGLRVARFMKQAYGIPYIAGLPIGTAQNSFFETLSSVMKTGEDAELSALKMPITSAGVDADTGADTGVRPDADTLIVGDSVFSNSIAHALYQSTGKPADTAAIFGTKPADGVYTHDHKADEERKIMALVNDEKYKTVIADPLICDLVRDSRKHVIPIAHYAVSGRFGQADERRLFGDCYYPKNPGQSDRCSLNVIFESEELL